MPIPSFERHKVPRARWEWTFIHLKCFDSLGAILPNDAAALNTTSTLTEGFPKSAIKPMNAEAAMNDLPEPRLRRKHSA